MSDVAKFAFPPGIPKLSSLQATYESMFREVNLSRPHHYERSRDEARTDQVSILTRRSKI